MAEFRTIPYDGSFEHFFERADKPKIVISAVDNNYARHALQEQYAPLFMSASTQNLRAETMRCGPPSIGACLACFNPLEKYKRTDEEIRVHLRDRPKMIPDLCKEYGLDIEDVKAWIQEPKCGQTGERLIQALRTDDGSLPRFAVGFVSVLAGTLLAAELLKVLAQWFGPLDDKMNRAIFQFQNPESQTNRSVFYPRDERCTSCSPENSGAQVWINRYNKFMNRKVL
jgi:hypothetical protein